MKKFLCLLLAITLIAACVAVPGFALQTDDADTHNTEPCVLNDSEELQPDDNADAVSNVDEKSPELRESRDTAEFEAIHASIHSTESTLLGNADISTYAASYTVSGRVLLPTDVVASAGDIIRVYAYNSMQESDNVKIDLSENPVKSVNAVLATDKASATFSMSLPAGKYIFAVRYLSGNKNVSGNLLWYTADGMTPNKYIADVISVSSNKTINLSLKKSESYITGTITDIPESTEYIGISMYTGTSTYTSSNYIYLSTNGKTSVNYQIGLDASNYTMYLSFSGNGAYYNSSGLVDNYSDRRILDVTTPIEELDFSAEYKTDDSDREYKVTLKFANPLTEEKKYFLMLADEEFANAESSSWYTLEKGDTEAVFYVDKPEGIADGQKLYLMYQDITAADSVTWQDNAAWRYYSKDLGYTSDKSKATDVSVMTEVTITEPKSYTITGSLSEKNGNSNISSCIYVGAEFEDEIFYTRARIGGSYRIDIPERMKNKTFKLFTADGEGRMPENSRTYSGSERTLSGDLSGIAVESFGFKKVTGTVTVPTAAPKDGLNFELEYVDSENWDYYYNRGIVTLKKGETSAEYGLYVPEFIEEGYISANLAAYEKVNITSSADSDSLTEADLDFYTTVTISGTVSLPSGMTASKDITIQISTSGASYEYAYVTVPKGQNSANYAVHAAAGQSIRYMSTYINTKDTGLLQNVYYDKDGVASGAYKNFGITLNEDTVMNLSLIKSAYINGTISLPAGAVYTGGQVGYRIYCENTKTNQTYSKYYNTSAPNAEKEFSVSIPYEEDATYRLYVYVSEPGNSDIMKYKNYYYVSDTQMTYDESSAATVDGSGSYKLYFPVGSAISGKVSFASDAMVKDGTLSGHIYAISQTNGSRYYARLGDFSTFGDIEYRLSVPDDASDTYVLYIYIGKSNNDTVTNIGSNNLYYSASGLVTSQDSATAVAQGTTVDFAIPTMRSVSGKIIVGDDFEKIGDIGKVQGYLKGETGSTKYCDAYVDSDLNYTLYIKDNDLTGKYTPQLALGRKAVNNIIYGDYSYGTGDDKYINIEKNTNVTGKNINVETGYALSGKIMLPSDAVITGYKYTPSVSFGRSSAGCAQSLSSTNSTVDYMIGVEENAGSNRLSVSCSSYSATGENQQSNLYENDIYRIDNTTSTTAYADGKAFTVNSDMSNVNITLMTAAIVKVVAACPSGVYDTVYADVYIEDENGDRQTYGSVWMYPDSNASSREFRLDKKLIGKKMYMYYEMNDYWTSDSLYNEKLYINPDGSFSPTRESATPFILAADQTVSFTPASSDLKMTYMKLEKSYYGNTFDCDVYDNADSGDTAILIFANYDSNGILVDLEIEEDIELGQTVSKSYTNTNTGERGTVKVMLVSSLTTMTPLAKSQFVEY